MHKIATTEAAVPNLNQPENDKPSLASDGDKRALPTSEGDNDKWSIWSTRGKRVIIFSASFASLLSPLSSLIYFPALEPISKDLQVSDTMVNLSISTYIIFQGIAPTFSAQLSDTVGRRPVYLVCLALFLASNIGLSIQNNYTALLVLRCFQSAGSSGMPAVSSAVAADIATPAERGSYVSFAAAVPMLAMALVSIFVRTFEIWQIDSAIGACHRRTYDPISRMAFNLLVSFRVDRCRCYSDGIVLP